MLKPLLSTRLRSWLFLLMVAVLFLIAVVFPALRLVPLKLLPYDNKDEFQVVVDMPEGTTLERTQGVVSGLEYLFKFGARGAGLYRFCGRAVPHGFQRSWCGIITCATAPTMPISASPWPSASGVPSSPMQFCCAFAGISKRLPQAQSARIKLVEVPPGPPVISTITVELYGGKATPYRALQQAAGVLEDRLRHEPLVVDVDTSVEEDQQKIIFVPDKEKAALSGIGTEDIARTVMLANHGLVAGYMQIPSEVNPLPVVLRLPFELRSAPNALANLQVKGRPGITKIREKSGLRDAPQPMVPLAELGRIRYTTRDKVIHHKNLQPVVYVFADIAGRPPAEIVLDVASDMNRDPDSMQPVDLGRRTYLNPGGGVAWRLPADIHGCLGRGG